MAVAIDAEPVDIRIGLPKVEARTVSYKTIVQEPNPNFVALGDRLTALRTAQMEAEHRQTEGDEVRRLADGAKQAAALGQGDPLLPFTLRIYQVEAELGELEAKVKLAKAARDYQVALGEQPVPGLSQAILDGLVRDLGKK